jgi:hypothetical protein
MNPWTFVGRPVVCATILILVCGFPDRLRALDPAAMQAMVIVEGDAGRGSAFVVKMEGKTYLVTNSHVGRGNQHVKFKDLHNKEITTGPLQIADMVDAVRAEVAATDNVLELEPEIEKSVKIGDEVIVAGNSEGEGVVREIPGKVVGIGPDRVEVDAGFVPGNSGSPILLKATGKVIGVATYMKVPGFGRNGWKSPISLNETRRFGYRLDSVAKWITPSTPEHLAREGQQLADMEGLGSTVMALLSSNAATVTRLGSSSFLFRLLSARSPTLGALASAIDDFAARHTAATTEADKAKNAEAFFDQLKKLISEQMQGLTDDQFTGFYAVQFHEQLERNKTIVDWLDDKSMPAFRQTWLTSTSWTASRAASAPPVDPAKFKLALEDQVAADQPVNHQHRVYYAQELKPSNPEGLFWVVEKPTGEHKASALHGTGLRVSTPVDGTYHVYVEFRGTNNPVLVSNVIEFKVEGVPPGTESADASDAGGSGSKVNSVRVGTGRTALLSEQLEPQWQKSRGKWKIADGALTGKGDSITDCYVTVGPPFTLDFKIKVIDGMRPRVRIGSLECGNEGYEKTLALYPPGRDEGLFPYERGQSYSVSLVVTVKSVEFYVNGELISTGPGLDREVDKLEFSGGDSWSKGTTEYRDIFITK